jgi:AcrR family transcriptional regulator
LAKKREMSVPNPTSEIKIKEAATKVFLSKGFDGATTREIARESGMNLALVNYYFRSKEKLFREIFEEMIHLFFEGMIEIFHQSLTIKEKIIALIEHDYVIFKQHPDLVIFVVSEVHRNPERFFNMIQFKSIIDFNFFDEQFQQAINDGIIRNIRADSILLLITSPIQSLFSNKILIQHISDLTDEQYEEFTFAQKEIHKDMVIKYLFKE